MKPLSLRLSSHAAAYSLLGEKELPALLREAAALAKRYEEAPVGDCYRHPHLGPFAECLEEHVGQRVRLVVEGDA